MKNYILIIGLAFIYFMSSCSHEYIEGKKNDQEKLKEIASEYGFPNIQIPFKDYIPLTELKYCQFLDKLEELSHIYNTAEIVFPSRALADRSHRTSVTIDGCSFPLTLYWDEDFTGDRCYAVADGVCDHYRGPSHEHYNYCSKVCLYHVSTKQSESSIPVLYFVLRCNLIGYTNASAPSVSFSKHVEFIVKFNVETFDLETIVTRMEDGIWGPRDFENY